MKKTKKRRIRFDRICICILFVLVLVYGLIALLNMKISNIYVINNTFLKDQYIIEAADIDNYPSTLLHPSFLIRSKLKKNIYINNAKVYKKGLTKVYIEVDENKPIFYYQSLEKTILSDGNKVDLTFAVPTVINYITDSYYDKFIVEMSKLDRNVLNMISEIKFVPNDVDDNRFLFTMTDGNFVYVNIMTFEKMNRYLSIKEGLPNKNGVLYLDYGNNFEILK